MSTAICLKCGTTKRHPMARCGSCGYCPMGDSLAMVKSVILSSSYQIREDEEWKHRTRTELREIGDRIRQGVEFQFDQGEIDGLLGQKKLFDEGKMPSSLAIFGALLRTFRPLVIGLGVFGLVLLALAIYGAFGPGGTGRFDWSLSLAGLLLVFLFPLVFAAAVAVAFAITYSKLLVARLAERAKRKCAGGEVEGRAGRGKNGAP